MGKESDKSRARVKETPKGLPVVSAESVVAIYDTYTKHENWGNHLEEVKKRIVQENPALVSFIEMTVGKYPPSMHNSLFEVFVATIAILEHQAEANKMENQFGGNNRNKKTSPLKRLLHRK